MRQTLLSHFTNEHMEEQTGRFPKVTELEMAQQLRFESRGHAPSHYVILPSCNRMVKSVGSRAKADFLGLSFDSYLPWAAWL